MSGPSSSEHMPLFPVAPFCQSSPGSLQTLPDFLAVDRYFGNPPPLNTLRVVVDDIGAMTSVFFRHKPRPQEFSGIPPFFPTFGLEFLFYFYVHRL